MHVKIKEPKFTELVYLRVTRDVASGTSKAGALTALASDGQLDSLRSTICPSSCYLTTTMVELIYTPIAEIDKVIII